MDDLLNWVWQGCAVALVTTMALAVIERSRGRDRYLAVWVALLSVLALPLVPHVWEAASTPIAGSAPSTERAVISMPVAWWTSATTVAVLWGLWSAVAAGRLALAALSLRRVRAASSCLDDRRQARLPHWTAVRGSGRHTHVTVSQRVRSAAVLGSGSPVIAIAPSLLDYLTDDELDRIVIHEWAHVQRRDDLALVLQSCIRVVAGWHPAVWWLDRQLHLEREIACDELVVAVTGSAKGYAASLVKLASLPAVRCAPLPAVAAVAPIGLRRRIARILSSDSRTSGWPWKVAAASAGIFLCMVSGALGNVRAIEAAVITEARAIVRASVQQAGEPFAPTVLTSPTHVVSTTSSPSISSPWQTREPSAPVPMDAPRGTAQPGAAQASLTASALVAEIAASRVDGVFSAGAPLVVTSSGNAGGAAPLVPWRAAAAGSVAAGKAVGQQSQDAAVATANYFARLGRRIAGSF